MKHSKTFKRTAFVLLILSTLLLSGCLTDTPTIEGSGGNLYQEYPTQNVVNQPTANPQQQGGVSVNLPSTNPQATHTVNVINPQTPVVLSTQTAAPVTQIPVTINTNAPTATPSNILKKGATGSAVVDLQKKLKALGYYKGSADGDFGEGTEAAVKAFQQQMGLSVDGVAGLETLRKLANTTATMKPTASPTPKATNKPSYSENTYLKLGSSGSLVSKMQSRLIELGYLSGKATGKFDQATEDAVIAFQKRNCSYWDGVAGKLTLDALFSSSAKGTSTPAGMVGESLKEGSTGSAVRTLQTRLKALGYYTGNIDGDFGKSTTEAVKSFQRSNGLTADGKVGGDTMAVLNSSSAVAAGGSSLKKGATGSEVVTLQNRLKTLGYYTGSVDGDFGQSTEDAVKAFQKRNGLTADGKVGDETAARLYSSSAVRAEAPASNSLQEGSTGEKVVRLQSRLKVLGYYTGSVDGDFGESTKNAVRAFQRANGLTVDGKAGEETLAKLYGTSNVTAKPSATSTPIPDNVYVLVTPAPDGSYVTLERGYYGALVRTMQEELRSQGYYNGTCDGYFGEGTEEAVKRLQAAKGLQQDGKAGPATLRVLYEGDFPIGS